eukprot:COSAG02_NODE_6135_length_3776_cov_2.642371_3_plen_640_part_01
MPGPGSYDPSLDLVRQRSTSAQILLPSSRSSRKVKRPAQSAPGPGHYDIDIHHQAKNALIAPKPSAKRRVAAQEGAEPGPGAYAPKFDMLEPAVRGGAIARAEANESITDLTTLRRRLRERNSEKELKVARGESTEALDREISQLVSQIAQRRAPGPARYNPSVTPVRKRRTHGLIAPGARWSASKSVTDRLGPGSYDPEASLTERSAQFQRAPSINFGSAAPRTPRASETDVTVDSPGTPGPGAYFEDLTASTLEGAAPSSSFAGKVSPVSPPVSAPSTPGPGEYDADDRVARGHSPAASFAGTPRKDLSLAVTNTRTERTIDLDSLMNIVKTRARSVGFAPLRVRQRGRKPRTERKAPDFYLVDHSLTEPRVRGTPVYRPLTPKPVQEFRLRLRLLAQSQVAEAQITMINPPVALDVIKPRHPAYRFTPVPQKRRRHVKDEQVLDLNPTFDLVWESTPGVVFGEVPSVLEQHRRERRLRANLTPGPGEYDVTESADEWTGGVDFAKVTPRDALAKDGNPGVPEGDILDLRPSDAFIRAAVKGGALGKAERRLHAITETEEVIGFYDVNDDALSTSRRAATVTIYPPADPTKSRAEDAREGDPGKYMPEYNLVERTSRSVDFTKASTRPIEAIRDPNGD